MTSLEEGRRANPAYSPRPSTVKADAHNFRGGIRVFINVCRAGCYNERLVNPKATRSCSNPTSNCFFAAANQ